MKLENIRNIKIFEDGCIFSLSFDADYRDEFFEESAVVNVEIPRAKAVAEKNSSGEIVVSIISLATLSADCATGNYYAKVVNEINQ